MEIGTGKMKSLRDFTRWARTQPWDGKSLRTYHHPLGRTEVLFCESPWQVELVTVAPNTIIPEHAHLHTDSWEIFLAGKGIARIGHRVTQRDDAFDPPFTVFGFVPHSAWHSGEALEKGGLWLSAQYWLNGKPTSLSEDWIYRDASISYSSTPSD